MNISIPVAEACKLAEIDRKRFNEAVAAGHYSVAPVSEHGKPRLFDETDLITLVSYSMRLNEGWPPRLAGIFSSQLHRALRKGAQNEESVAIIVSVRGDRESHPASSLKEPVLITLRTAQPTHYEERVNVKWLREFVLKHVAAQSEDAS